MTVIEELLEIFKAQQQTIDTLTMKLDQANARIAELEEQLHKDSHNSSKPPSSDGFDKPAPKSQRKKSGKKAGGQTGQKGQHCTDCPHRTHCGKLKVHDTCYAVDIEIRKETVKYEIMACDCEGVQEVAMRPAGISGSVTYGNRLKAPVCVLSTKGMVAMKNLCEMIQGLTGIKLGSVDTKIIRRFSSRNFMQTRRKGAGRLSPVKPFQRRMREILPKRCVVRLGVNTT